MRLEYFKCRTWAFVLNFKGFKKKSISYLEKGIDKFAKHPCTEIPNTGLTVCVIFIILKKYKMIGYNFCFKIISYQNVKIFNLLFTYF